MPSAKCIYDTIVSKTKGASDVTVSGSATTVAAGFYNASVTKNVSAGSMGTPTIKTSTSGNVVTITATATDGQGWINGGTASSSTTVTLGAGTAGTPYATKGSVSNKAITVTPGVTNTTGYIAGGTKTGTGVTVSASELCSGSITLTSSGSTTVTGYQYAQPSAGAMGTPVITTSTSANVVTVTATTTDTAGWITGGTTSASTTVTLTPVTEQTPYCVKAGVTDGVMTVGCVVTNVTGWHTGGTTIQGIGVTVSASELVSGTSSATANGTYDVTAYKSITVAIPTYDGSIT